MPQAAAAPTTAEQTSAQKQIARARRLERERAELMKQIGKNREYLRLMADNEELSEAEEDWLDTFYPQKEKGERRSQDEVERTRRAREEARAGNGATA